MAVTSRDELIEFALRQLGYPVIEINIDPQQAEDCVDIALEFYFEFHSDGLEQIFHSHAVTQSDIDKKYITLPDEVRSVTKVFPIDNGYSKNVQYQMYITDIIDHALKGGISNFLISAQYYNTIDSILNREHAYRFNCNNSKLTILTDWDHIKVGDVLLLECFKILDPEEFSKIYNDRWLKNYVTALIKKQWASNVKKYSNFQLPSGITLDGASWYVEAIQEIKDLQEELRSTFEYPVMGMIG